MQPQKDVRAGPQRGSAPLVKILDSTLREGEQTPGVYMDVHIKLAVAHLLSEIGAGIIDATVMGLGERAGIVDLANLMTVLASDFGAGAGWNLSLLPRLYDLISRYADLPVPVNAPVTGRNAFTHCAGVYTQAALRNPLHYQSLDPALVGRSPEVSLDHMSGMSSIRHSLDRLGIQLDEEGARSVLRHVKQVGQTGRTVDLVELGHIARYVQEERADGLHEPVALAQPASGRREHSRSQAAV